MTLVTLVDINRDRRPINPAHVVQIEPYAKGHSRVHMLHGPPIEIAIDSHKLAGTINQRAPETSLFAQVFGERFR